MTLGALWRAMNLIPADDDASGDMKATIAATALAA